MAMNDDADYLLEGLMPKEALAADFKGEIRSVWSLDGDKLQRPENPFEELQDRIEVHKQNEKEIEQELKDQALQVADMQDILDTTMARKKTAADPAAVQPSADGTAAPPADTSHNLLTDYFQQNPNKNSVIIYSNDKGFFDVNKPKDGKAYVMNIQYVQKASNPRTVDVNQFVQELGQWHVVQKSKGAVLAYLKMAAEDSEESDELSDELGTDHLDAELSDTEKLDLILMELEQIEDAIGADDEGTEEDEEEAVEDGAKKEGRTGIAAFTSGLRGHLLTVLSDHELRQKIAEEDAAPYDERPHKFKPSKSGRECRWCGTDRDNPLHFTKSAQEEDGDEFEMDEPATEEPKKVAKEQTDEEAHEEPSPMAAPDSAQETVDPAALVDDLHTQVEQHAAEGDELRQELGDLAEETADLIDTFTGKTAKERKVDGPKKDDKTLSTDFNRYEHKKGDYVMSPNGLGRVEEVWEDKLTVTVRLLPTGELRPYQMNRCRAVDPKKAASATTAANLWVGDDAVVQGDPEELSQILDSLDIFDGQDESQSDFAAADVGMSGEDFSDMNPVEPTPITDPDGIETPAEDELDEESDADTEDDEENE